MELIITFILLVVNVMYALESKGKNIKYNEQLNQLMDSVDGVKRDLINKELEQKILCDIYSDTDAVNDLFISLVKQH